MVECRIERQKNVKFPLFFVYLEDGNQFLVAGRKRKKSKTSNYLVSIDKDDLARQSGNYVGKVRANFVGTDFLFYDKGEAPKEGSTVSEVGLRQELGAVIYVGRPSLLSSNRCQSSNILGLSGPRKMRVLLPTLKE